MVSAVSAIYGWASRPTRQLVLRNPVRDIELPPKDEKPRTRVAPLEEAEQQLLAALDPNDQVPLAAPGGRCAEPWIRANNLQRR